MKPEERRIPLGRDLVPHQTNGYSLEQSYARAFNERNHLKHTPFEAEPNHTKEQPT